MKLTRGKFGTQYRCSENEPQHHRTLIVLVVIIVAVAFGSYQISKSPGRAEGGGRSAEFFTPSSSLNSARRTPHSTPHAAPRIPHSALALVKTLQTTLEARPQLDRTQIMRYMDAELRGNVANAADALKRLYDRPTMADVRDRLMRRLGELNFAALTNSQNRLAGKSTAWTKSVTVRRGDGLERLAREHRNSIAALQLLNPTVDWTKLKTGTKVAVLNFPNANLVIHKHTGIADLSLRNERFFRRYYLSIAKTAPCAVYPITSTPSETMTARFRQLGVKITPNDRKELELFMSSGSRIVIAEQ